MTEQQTVATEEHPQQTTNGGDRHESPEALRIKAEHRQALARLEADDRRMLAEMARNMPIPLRVMFDPMLNERVKSAAQMMAEARGFTPPHLIGKTEACFVVVTKALTWRLDPQAVAASTFQTPDGKVGYEGKLIQAIIEGSGKLSKPIGQGEYFGDWSRVRGKFKIVRKRSNQGKEYDAAEPLWTYWGEEEEGLGIRYQVWLKDQTKPLQFEFLLKQAFPRNATTWPTRPDIQCHYAAMRALGNVVCPSLLMGVPGIDDQYEPAPTMKDVTPPKAPPLVDLRAEGISGEGHMTEADEAQQREAARAKEAPAPKAQRQEPEAERPSWTIDGKTYVQAGRVEKALIEKIEAIESLDELGYYEDDNDGAAFIATLPDQNRQAVEQAVAHKRSVLEAAQERGMARGEADDGDEDEQSGRGQPTFFSQ